MKPAITISLVSPGGTFDETVLNKALLKAEALGLKIAQKSLSQKGSPGFLNGSMHDRLGELKAAENSLSDAIWCVRGGCGAIELWQTYRAEIYQNHTAPLIGYSDNTILHFMRFERANRIGIHGPCFLDLTHESSLLMEALELIITKRAHELAYPALKRLNFFTAKQLNGQLLVMNLASLQTLLGSFDVEFLQGKILCIEDVNEPHYKIFRMLHHLKNVSALAGLKALVIGHIGPERAQIIEESVMPLVTEFGIPLFDWPIFGHEQPNWPLMFGARVAINAVDGHFFTLTYEEQHDHSPIRHDHE